MVDLVVDTSLSPLDQETQVLTWFQNSGVVNPKKLVKMAEKVKHLVPDFICRSIIDNVLNARYPAKFLAEAYREMSDYPFIIAGLIADGNHGMLMHKDNIYGMVVNARWDSWLKEENRWNGTDEVDLQDEMVNSWMEENLIRSFHGRIVLFKEFGFSGMARQITQTMTKEFYEELVANRKTLTNLEKLCG